MGDRIRGCWSCGSHGPCSATCNCAKCIDPLGYEWWRTTRPDQYASWLLRQRLLPGEECDCPICKGAVPVAGSRLRLVAVRDAIRPLQPKLKGSGWLASDFDAGA